MGLRHVAAAVSTIVIALTLPATAAQAHTPASGVLVASTPADGSALATPPTEVELTFSAEVDTEQSHAGMSTTAGQAVRTGLLRRTGPRRASMPVTITAAGDYQVAYHAVFTDGAFATGVVRFSVGTGLPPAGSATQIPLGGHNHDIDPLNAILLAADGVTALAVILLLLRRRAPDSSPLSPPGDNPSPEA